MCPLKNHRNSYSELPLPRGGTFGDTVSGTWGGTSSRGGIRGGTSWDAQDCH